ncbi:hypothetical protein H4582DRAFT_1987751, partial [Lactarius indigo]
MSPFASPSPFMSNRRPEPSPPLTHERGGAQEWHPPFARNGGATGTPPLPSFTREQDTRTRDKPPPPLPFARKEEAQERGADTGRLRPPSLLPPLPCLVYTRTGHATRDGVGKARALSPPFLPGTRAPCQRQRRGPPWFARRGDVRTRGRRRGENERPPHPLRAPPRLYAGAVRERGGALQPGVAPPSPWVRAHERRANRGARQSKTRRGGGGGGRPLSPGLAHKGETRRSGRAGHPLPPGSRTKANRERAATRTRPPFPWARTLGRKREGVAAQDPPPLPGSRARAKPRRGGRAGHPPSGFARQGQNAKGWPRETTTLFPGFAHQGKTPRGQPRPPGFTPGQKREQAATRRPSPLPQVRPQRRNV